MAQINLGIIGYGIRSKFIVSACSAFDEVKLTAVADISPAAQQAAAADYPGISVFEDYREMLDSGKVNAVLVETPPKTHAACSIDALNRNIHVLCDVPAVNEIEEAQALWDAGRKSKAVYMFGATTNFWAYVDTSVDLKNKGLLGNPFYCEAEYVADLGDLVNVTPWRKNYEPIKYCTHSLGPILKWFDEDLTEVSCFDTGSHVHNDPKEHDAMVAIFKTKSNIVVKLLTSFVNNHPVPFHRYVCHGTKGYFERTQPLVNGESHVLFASREIYGAQGLMKLPVTETRPEMEGIGEHGGADYCMMKSFAEAIIEGKEPAVNMKEALRMTLPGLYALKSAEAGGELTKISYPWGK